MKVWEVRHRMKGWDIACQVGGRVYWSWWTSPPEGRLIADQCYLKDRYPIITTEGRANQFKELYKKMWPDKEMIDRCDRANQMIQLIATTDRKFFNTKGNIAKFIVGDTNKVIYIDNYTQKSINIDKEICEWDGFSHGGTLKRLVYALGEWIRGEKDTFYNVYSTSWAYSLDGMYQIVEKARALGMIPKGEDTFKEYYDKLDSKGYVIE
ncbi:MAG: hypothetical protein AB9856_03660 [Cellulosilyticaceae bacterium]